MLDWEIENAGYDKPPAGAPPPTRGDRYVVIGLILGMVVGGVVGGVLGAVSHHPAFLTAIAGLVVGAFPGTLLGDRFRKRVLKKRNEGARPPQAS